MSERACQLRLAFDFANQSCVDEQNATGKRGSIRLSGNDYTRVNGRISEALRGELLGKALHVTHNLRIADYNLAALNLRGERLT
jgi:hypothetical protein